MEEQKQQKKGFVLKAGWPCWILSAAIVASRACCSSLPMEDWSWWSWALMLAPALFPWYAFAAWCALASCAGIVVFFGELFRKRRRGY